MPKSTRAAAQSSPSSSLRHPTVGAVESLSFLFLLNPFFNWWWELEAAGSSFYIILIRLHWVAHCDIRDTPTSTEQRICLSGPKNAFIHIQGHKFLFQVVLFVFCLFNCSKIKIHESNFSEVNLIFLTTSFRLRRERERKKARYLEQNSNVFNKPKSAESLNCSNPDDKEKKPNKKQNSTLVKIKGRD